MNRTEYRRRVRQWRVVTEYSEDRERRRVTAECRIERRDTVEGREYVQRTTRREVVEEC